MRIAQLLLTAGLLAASPSVQAQQPTPGEIHVGHPWTRATPPRAEVAGGYMTIENIGAADRLTGGSSPAAARVEVHSMSVDNGVMTMRQLPDGLALPAGGTVALAPGGLHLMLIGLAKPLKQGESVPLTLTFERSGSVEVELTVEGMGATGMEHGPGEKQAGTGSTP